MEHVPTRPAKIVFDRFHIMQHMTDAVNDVRKDEHRRLQAEGDHSPQGEQTALVVFGGKLAGEM